MTQNPALVIRPLDASDEAEWRRLWRGYLDYYKTVLPEAVYATTFSRLLAGGPGEFRGRLALLDGRPAGLVHYVAHPSSWVKGEVCYLQDLFTAPEARGMGIGRALIERVYAEADASGTPAVYWFTEGFNATARRLYDRIGVLTPFIRYNRRAGETGVPAPGTIIRPVQTPDEAAWRALWQDYLTFYETALPQAVTAATFARITSGDPLTIRGLLLEAEGQPVGLVHYVMHRTCWKEERVTYLQDLYVRPEIRGRGLGRALIGAVYDRADAAGAPAVYWLTQSFNLTARRLYDRIGVLTPFLEYDRPS
jgi:GNAT superfamily N-acetyltransferase